jgi:hypothetical protein
MYKYTSELRADELDIYHIPYHGQKSDIISYPISRLKKDRILYPISLPSKISQNYSLFKERFFFGKVTKELFRILSIYIRSLKKRIFTIYFCI